MPEIQLTKGFVTTVDEDDYERLNTCKWFVIDSHPRHAYAVRWSAGTYPNRKSIRMHHEVLLVTAGYLGRNDLVVDHINRNSLDNRKENLRIVSKSENIINSEYCDKAKGIYYDRARDRYKAFLLRPRTYIGTFETLEEALEVRAMYENN